MSLFIESMSERRGTLLSVVFPSAMRVAAMIGSAEFLLPEISILPLRRVPPLTMKESISPVPGPLGPKGSARRVFARNARVRRHPFGLSASPLADDQSMLARQTCRFIGRASEKTLTPARV